MTEKKQLFVFCAGIENPEYIFKRYYAKKFEGYTVPVGKDSCRGHLMYY